MTFSLSVRFNPPASPQPAAVYCRDPSLPLCPYCLNTPDNVMSKVTQLDVGENNTCSITLICKKDCNFTNDGKTVVEMMFKVTGLLAVIWDHAGNTAAAF